MRFFCVTLLCVNMSLANAIEPPPQLTFKDAWEKCPTVIWGVVKETHLVKETVKVWAAQEANLDFIVVDLIVLSSVKGDVKPGTVLKFYWGLDPTIFGNTTFGESPKVGFQNRWLRAWSLLLR